jgi:hypothetical protein
MNLWGYSINFVLMQLYKKNGENLYRLQEGLKYFTDIKQTKFLAE